MDALLRELQALERELHHAGEPANPQGLARLLHPAFFEVGKSGVRYTRAQVLNHLLTRGASDAVRSDAYELHGLSADCTLLTYTSWHGDGPRPLKVLRSSVWRRTAEGWQLVYHQGTVAA